MAEMEATLIEIEQAFGLEGQLLHNTPVVKIFSNTTYRETWDGRWIEGHGVCQWASQGEPSSASGISSLVGAAGIGRVHAAGWVDVPRLIATLEQHFQALGALHEKAWSVSDGLPQGADAVVDCRGVGAAPELKKKGVQINLNHGDVLTLSTPVSGPGSLQTEGQNINNGKWLLPTQVNHGRQFWRLGATYSWHRTKPTPDVNAAVELRAHIAKAFDEDGKQAIRTARLEGHEAGLRPASPDRRPMVGSWPGQVKGVLLLNGLGTRGVLVGPAAAKCLVEWWLDGVEVPSEMQPTRFKSVQVAG